MSRAKSELADLKRQVERQSGAARALAAAMRSEAENSVLLGDGQSRLILDWAETIRGIGDALTAAMSDGDKSAVRTWTRALRNVAMPIAAIGLAVTTGAAEGAAGATIEALFHSGVIADRVIVLEDGCDELDRLLTREQPADEQTHAEPRPIGAVLREWRKHAGLTQAELSRQIHIGIETISKVENGHRRPQQATLNAWLAVIDPEHPASLAVREQLDTRFLDGARKPDPAQTTLPSDTG